MNIGKILSSSTVTKIEKAVLKESDEIAVFAKKTADMLDIVKPKKINIKNLLDPKLLDDFKSIKHLDNENFVKKAYSKLTEHLGLKEIAPELVYGARKDMDGLAAFSRIEGKIYIDPSKIKDQADAINSLTHELKHSEQFGVIARYEKGKGFAPVSRMCFSADEMKNFNRAYYDNVVNRLGVIKSDHPDAAIAKKYAGAIMKSVRPTNDIMEKEAYKIGDKVEKAYLKNVEGLSPLMVFKRNWIDIFKS